MTIDFTPGKPIRTYNADGKWRDWSTDELVGVNLNRLKDWKCGAGVDSLFIDMDGNVYAASCRVGGKLGSVWDTFSTPSDWVDCTKNSCTCGADLFIPKSQTIEFKHILLRSKNLPTIGELRDDSQTEFVAMERTHASTQKQVYWEIGRRCNYDCAYCWPWIHNNTDPHKSLEDLMKATHLIEEKFTKGESVNFIISGGEPTANKDFLDWLRYLNACGHHVSLHSNGSRKPDYYKEIIHYGDLNISAHFEFYNRDKFVKVVAAVTAEKVANDNQNVGHLEVKMMMAPHDRDEALALEEALRAIPDFVDYCTWAIVPIRGSLNNKNAKPGETSGESIMVGYSKDDFKLFGDRK